MEPIFLIVGPPAVGKSTTSRAVAARYPRGAHISVDDLRMMVVSGLVLPGPVWSDPLVEQVSLARRSASQMALNYHQAGFAVVIDDFWDPNYRADYSLLLDLPETRRIVLYPDQEAAHQRNRSRSGAGADHSYIDQGIRDVYRQLRDNIDRLALEGWQIVDSTQLSVEETTAKITGDASTGQPAV